MIHPTWKEISKIFSFILLFGVLAYNLYNGAEIWTSLYRAAVVFLVYGIISLIASNVIAKVFHSYEKRRILEEMEKARMEKTRVGKARTGKAKNQDSDAAEEEDA